MLGVTLLPRPGIRHLGSDRIEAHRNRRGPRTVLTGPLSLLDSHSAVEE
jgi:hypothetical protein